MRRKKYFLICNILLLAFVASASQAQEGNQYQGDIKLSYSFFDQEGKRSTTQEVYNIYSDFSLGHLGFQYYFARGSRLNLSLANLNRGDRNLSLGFQRKNWLDFKLSHHQSRFFFGENQENSTRNTSSGGITIRPLKSLKLFANYTFQKKRGDRIGVIPDIPGVLGTSYDQRLQNGHLGFQLNAKKSFLDYSYRVLDFDSRLNEAFDRRSYRHQISFSSSLPKNILLSSQYLRDDAKLTESDLELDTDLYTLALLYRALRGLSLSGKFFYQKTENQATQLTSKTFKTSYNIVYEVVQILALEAGYEYERRKDENGKNHLNSFLVGAKSKPRPNLKLKAQYVRKERKDKNFSTLVGPYDSDNFLFNLQYQPIQKFKIDLRYKDQQKDNDQILTFTDSKGFISFVTFTYNEELSIDATFSMLNVEYQDSFGRFFNKTRNLLVNLRLKPLQKFSLNSGVTFLDVSGDLDIRREDFNLGVEYLLPQDFSVEFRYEVYNYDDDLQPFDFYTLNVFTLGLGKRIGSF